MLGVSEQGTECGERLISSHWSGYYGGNVSLVKETSVKRMRKRIAQAGQGSVNPVSEHAGNWN